MAGVYFGIESGVVVVSMVERPATGGAWVLADSFRKAGPEVGSAPCNPPPIGFASPGKLPPWGLPRLYALRGMGF